MKPCLLSGSAWKGSGRRYLFSGTFIPDIRPNPSRGPSRYLRYPRNPNVRPCRFPDIETQKKVRERPLLLNLREKFPAVRKSVPGNSGILFSDQLSDPLDQSIETHRTVSRKRQMGGDRPGPGYFLILSFRHPVEFCRRTDKNVRTPELPRFLSTGKTSYSKTLLDRFQVTEIETFQFPAGDPDDDVRHRSHRTSFQKPLFEFSAILGILIPDDQERSLRTSPPGNAPEHIFFQILLSLEPLEHDEARVDSFCLQNPGKEGLQHFPGRGFFEQEHQRFQSGSAPGKSPWLQR